MVYILPNTIHTGIKASLSLPLRIEVPAIVSVFRTGNASGGQRFILFKPPQPATFAACFRLQTFEIILIRHVRWNIDRSAVTIAQQFSIDKRAVSQVNIAQQSIVLIRILVTASLP